MTEYTALKRVEKLNNNYINNYEEDNKIKENISSINDEIKETREYIKNLTDDYNLLEKYFKLIHEKITGMEIAINKKKREVKEVKKEEEKKKLFKNEEVKDAIEVIFSLRNQIIEKRSKLSNIKSDTEEKMHDYFSQNRNVEMELKENLKKYKELVTKKNNLKRQINKLKSKQKGKVKYYIKENNAQNLNLNNK